FVDGFARLDESAAALLRVGQTVRQSSTRRRCCQGAVALVAELAGPAPVADPDRAHEPSPCRHGEEEVPEADQAAGWHHVLQPDLADLAIHDLEHLAAAAAECL